jgi:hypothetical protein
MTGPTSSKTTVAPSTTGSAAPASQVGEKAEQEEPSKGHQELRGQTGVSHDRSLG